MPSFQLVPAPYCPAVWEGRFDEILELLEQAGSRTVRVFCRNSR